MLGPDKLELIEQDDLVARWQRHRQLCLDLAIRIGVKTPEQAINVAEALSAYILGGKPKTDAAKDQVASPGP
jgi:hypothetical protein